MMTISFAWAWCFLALPLPWLFGRHNHPSADTAAVLLPRLPEAARHQPAPLQRMSHGLAWLIWLLLVLAAARPQTPGEPVAQTLTGHSLMLAVDVSASMGTADLRQAGGSVKRLQAAKILTDTFLASRQGDRVGLIVFGSQAYLHTPPTFDLAALRNALATADIGLAGRETALGDAIALATKHLATLPETRRNLVVITDGAHNSGTLTPQRAAWLARREGVRIHCVHLGSRQMESESDENTLREIAEPTGGRYVRATDSDDLANFWQQWADIPASEQGQRITVPRQELYHWPLGCALLMGVLLGIRQRLGWRP